MLPQRSSIVSLAITFWLYVLRTMSYEDAAFMSIPPYKFDHLLIRELKAEVH